MNNINSGIGTEEKIPNYNLEDYQSLLDSGIISPEVFQEIAGANSGQGGMIIKVNSDPNNQVANTTNNYMEQQMNNGTYDSSSSQESVMGNKNTSVSTPGQMTINEPFVTAWSGGIIKKKGY